MGQDTTPHTLLCIHYQYTCIRPLRHLRCFESHSPDLASSAWWFPGRETVNSTIKFRIIVTLLRLIDTLLRFEMNLYCT